MKLCEIQLKQSARTLWMMMGGGGTHVFPGVSLRSAAASGLLLEAQQLQWAFTQRTVRCYLSLAGCLNALWGNLMSCQQTWSD